MTVWDPLADTWNNQRQRRSAEITEERIQNWTGKILDVGCGNARNLAPFNGELHGIDNSKEMLKYAKKYLRQRGKKGTLQHADMTKIPYPDNTFDHIICFAALHHISLPEQETALKEMRRVLKPKGTFFLTVWNLWQQRFILKGHEQMIPWKHKGTTHYRYYFLHTPFTFKKLIKKEFPQAKIRGMFKPNLVAQYQKG